MRREYNVWGSSRSQTVNLVRAIYVSAIISMGFGQHLIPLVEADPVKATALLRLLVILQAIGLWTFTLPKLPVVALLTRLFGFNKPAVRYVLLGSVSIQLIMVMIMTITTFVQCEPIAAQCMFSRPFKFWYDIDVLGDLSVEGTCWARYINVDIGYSVGGTHACLRDHTRLSLTKASLFGIPGCSVCDICHSPSVEAPDGAIKKDTYRIFTQFGLCVSLLSRTASSRKADCSALPSRHATSSH